MSPSTGDRKRLLLTGASGRFGAEFIERFAQRFDILALTNTRSITSSSQKAVIFDAVNEIHERNAVTELRCDLLDIDATTALLKTISDLGGPITYLVNAAADVRFLGSTLDAVYFGQEATKQWRVNVLAPMAIASTLFHSTWKNVPVSRQNAAILNLSSVSGRSVFPDSRQASYASSKAALDMSTLYMAAEYKAYGIRVNGLAPGAFPSEMPTSKVVDAAFKILEGRETGKIYALGSGKS